MNLAINGTCAKGCSFCFTKEDARVNHTLGEMSIEKVGELLNHFDLKGSGEEITILGGEPTQHSNFQGIVNYIISRGYKINLVSNLLFGKRTLDYIIENIRHIRWVLPNGAELNEKNRMNLFKKNYLSLYSAYANTWGFEENPRLYIAITLSSDFKERKMFEYVKWLYQELDGKLNAIRLGLDLTGTYLVNGETNQFKAHARTGSANDPLLTDFLSENSVLITVDEEIKNPGQLQTISGYMFLLFPIVIIGLQIKILYRTKTIEKKIQPAG